MKGESVVKTPFMVTDEPHVKEKTVKPPPIMERPRFSIDGERPKFDTQRTNSSRHHESGKRERSHRTEKEKEERDREREKNREREKEKHKSEEEKERRRARRETDKQMEIARRDVAENARKQQEQDDEERRIRREERRKRREEEERVLDEGKVNEREGERSRHRHRHSTRSKEPEKPKGALSSLWSSVKKVIN